jgi:hypothetical protein
MSSSGFLFGAMGAMFAWLAVEFVGRPFRRFFDLRGEVSRRLTQFGNVPGRGKWVDNSHVEPIKLSPAQDARLTEAENVYRDLASQMRGFASAEWLAELIVRYVFRFNAREISKALIGLSNEIPTYGPRRDQLKKQIQELLRIHALD